ncbi:MAG: aldehyde dehydrogenase family protein [Actinomycetes bacterium]
MNRVTIGPIGNLIGGKLEPGRGTEEISVLNPATEEVLGSFTDSNQDDIDRAVVAAQNAQPGWAGRTPGARADHIRRLADLVEDHLDELATLEVLDAGKPWTASRGEELPGILDSLRHFGAAARLTTSQPAGEYVEGNTSYLRREPVGVVAAITPWNFPLWQAVWKIGPAVAAGNAVVIKPAENTPLSTLRFVQLASEILPPGVINLVQGRGATAGAALVAHAGVDLVSFTGSTRAGRLIAAAAAAGPKRAILELGGNSPVVVFNDVDIERAVANLSGTALYNAGQECMAATRLIIQSGVRDEFLAALAAAISSNTIMGDPFAAETTLGPLISRAQLDRVRGLLERRPAGSRFVIGGSIPDGPGFFVPPTIVDGVSQHDELVQEEIFGPVATAQTFADEAEALRLANDVQYGLAGSVWTRDIARGLRMVNSMNFGNVWINNHLALGPDLPIGGFRGSGYGKEGGQAGIEEFTRIKQVVISLT